MLKEISIEIIRKCPNNCLHCSSFSNKNCSEIIPYELFKKVVSGAKNLGLKTVCFSGGEPFLHPDIIEMIEYVYDIIHFLRREMLDFTAFPVFFVSNLLLVQRKKYYFNRATVSRNCSIVL